MAFEFADMTSSSICFDVDVFLLSSLVNVPSLMSVSWLALEVWQFSFIKEWPEIWKSEIQQSEFCPISGDWSKLGIPNLAQIFLIKYYWILQNASVTAFNISELLRENQQWEGVVKSSPLTPPPLPHNTHTHTLTRVK